MFIVRPVAADDIPALEEMASTAAPLVPTFPRTRQSIERAVERSLASFAARPHVPGSETYLFVLSDMEGGAVSGLAAISATAGGSGTFFAFRRDVFNQVSRDLDISHHVHALILCSDLTGHSQLSGFHLRDRRKAGHEAALLSRARLLFASVAPQRFGDRFFAALAGVADGHGRSPFWEAVGRKFFQMDFLEAERMLEGARNRSVIVELMPHYPVYVPLLSPEAQAALGQVHEAGTLPGRLLGAEGFERGEYVDIFDGGAILRAHRNAIRSFSQAMFRTAVVGTGYEDGEVDSYLVATSREEDFRAVLAECPAPDVPGCVALAPEALHALGVVQGEDVLCVKL